MERYMRAKKGQGMKSCGIDEWIGDLGERGGKGKANAKSGLEEAPGSSVGGSSKCIHIDFIGSQTACEIVDVDVSFQPGSDLVFHFLCRLCVKDLKGFSVSLPAVSKQDSGRHTLFEV